MSHHASQHGHGHVLGGGDGFWWSHLAGAPLAVTPKPGKAAWHVIVDGDEWRVIP
jgi:hypothetical protein